MRIVPLITESAFGETVLEWAHKEKKLALFISKDDVGYLKSWGVRNDEVEDGEIHNFDQLSTLFSWLNE